MWHYYFSRRSPFSIELISKFERFCKIICLDDKEQYDDHTKKYNIKLIPALVTETGRVIEGNELIKWLNSPNIEIHSRPEVILKNTGNTKNKAYQLSRERKDFNPDFAEF